MKAHSHNNESILDNTTASFTIDDNLKLNGIENGAQINTITGIKGSAESSYRTGDITLSANDIGAIDINLKGNANGVAELDENGIVPSSQLPSYVDDVLEYDNKDLFPTIGESGKIYIDVDTNIQYRWTGTQYIEISNSNLVLGETSSTAYRGDRGKIAYEHSQSVHSPSDAQANVIETVKVNGTALTPNSKAVNITVPTKTSQLENDSGYVDNSMVGVSKDDEGITNIEYTLYSVEVGGKAKLNGETSLRDAVANFTSYIATNMQKLDEKIPTAVEPVNNLFATVAGSPLDAVQGKVLDDKVSKINTYVSDDGKLHFVDSEGADTELPFSSGGFTIPFILSVGTTDTEDIGKATLTIPLEVLEHIQSIKAYNFHACQLIYNSTLIAITSMDTATEKDIDYEQSAVFTLKQYYKNSASGSCRLAITFK